MKDDKNKEAVRRLQVLIARETGSPLGRAAAAEIESIIQYACGVDGVDAIAGLDHTFVPCEVTILLADLRGFTAITSSLPAGTVIAMLNRCLSRMNEIVSHHHGVIDKFMGDSIMVLFGAPVAHPDDVKRALTCAIEMQLAMAEINNRDRPEGLPELFMGIGINTGTVMAGKFGSNFYSEYTVIGDEVNLTSRIEAFTLRGQVLISENTFNCCRDFVAVSEAMEVFVKGKSLPVKLRELYAIPLLGLEVPRKEVRRSHRAEVSVPCVLQIIQNKCVMPEIISATVCDIGYHGMLIEVEYPIQPMDDLKLEFELPLVAFKARDIYAKVVKLKRKGERVFAGLEFTSVSTDANMKIQLLVQFLVTEAA